MNDLEMVKACAVAMGLTQFEVSGVPQNGSEQSILIVNDATDRGWDFYSPLTDDEQAMQLMKRIGVTAMWTRKGWETSVSDPSAEVCKSHALNLDLNRAIVECVARLSEKEPSK